MDVILKILQVAIGLGLIILLHEFGHFIVARWCGVRAHAFSIGFGPAIWRWRPKYPWRPGAKDFKYNNVLGPDLLEDRERLREMMALMPGTNASRLRIVEWPVEKLQPGMVRVVKGEVDGRAAEVPQQLDEAAITTIRDSGDKTVRVFDAGETEYRLATIPLGGYVAMAGGEVPSEGHQQGLPDEFLSKKPGQKAAILIAGVAMNAITAFLFFIMAYGIGVETPPAVVGDAAVAVPAIAASENGEEALDPAHPGPAWIAGLQSGDRIIGIETWQRDGEAPPPVTDDPADAGRLGNDLDFTDVRIAVAFADPDERVRLTVLRDGIGADGKPGILTVDVDPVYNPVRGFMNIGINQTLTPRIEAIDPALADALEGKLKRNDMIVAVNGTDLPLAFPMPEGTEENPDRPWPRSYPRFKELLRQVPADAETVKLAVMRDGERVEVDVPVTRQPVRLRLGLDSQPLAPARAVRPGGPASQAVKPVEGENGELIPSDQPLPLQAGDRIVSVAGSEPTSFEHLQRLVQTLEEGTPALFTIQRQTGETVNRHQVFIAPVRDWGSGELVIQFLPDYRDVTNESANGLLIRGVDPDGPAAAARFLQVRGDVPEDIELQQTILTGDRLLKVNDKPVNTWGMTRDTDNPGVGDLIVAGWDQQSTANQPVRLQVVRRLDSADVAEGQAAPEVVLEFEVTPRAWDTDIQNRVGFVASPAMISVQHMGLKAIEVGMWKTWVMTQQVFLTLRSLFAGTVDPKNIGGPVMIATVSYRFAGWGLGTFIYFMAIISINLAIINLLPIPILDGGHLVFVGIEKIRGKPVSERVHGIATWFGLACILLLIVFVMYNDINRLISG